MGNCSTYRERYYFDLVDKTCKKFYYTGCNGNRNNFGSLEECSSSCSTQPELIPESLPRVSPEETSLDLSSDDERATNKCEFSCALNCPFGYRLNYRTNCPICECSMLRMTVSLKADKHFFRGLVTTILYELSLNRNVEFLVLPLVLVAALLPWELIVDRIVNAIHPMKASTVIFVNELQV